MKVQKIVLPETKQERWLVLDESLVLVEPIRAFVQHLDHVERSPKTIRTYAYHLRVFWEYLAVAPDRRFRPRMLPRTPCRRRFNCG
ncbi:MAG: hypothetical protein K1Y36_26415 [Blastocatellia bacterium]|nr:hypothetical protein [Blastocatellia bacterium]